MSVKSTRKRWSASSQNSETIRYVLFLLYQEHSQAFLTRVSKRDAPDYYDVIQNPMDLGTMQKKLRSGQYKTKAQFAHDLNLIWDNCFLYNASPQHPLRRNATFMRKKADHLLEFLSDKNDTKDLISHWHPSTTSTPQPESEMSAPDTKPIAAAAPTAATTTTAPPSTSSAATAVAAQTKAPETEIVRDDTPLPQRAALRRTADSSLVFSDLDTKLTDMEQTASSDVASALHKLDRVSISHNDPLSTALQHAPRSMQQKWWAACTTDTMLCAGIPSIGYAGAVPSDPGPSSNAAYTSRLPMHWPGIPRLMARNIRTLQRLQRTHQKFFQLAEAVELDLPVPASLGDVSSDDEEDEDLIVGPSTWTPPSPHPRLTASYARSQASWQVQTLLAHAGFEGAHAAAAQVLTDVATEYMMGLARTLRLYTDRFAHEFSAEDIVEHVLAGRGSGLEALETYVTHDIGRYGQRLKEWLSKLQNTMREQLQYLGGTVEDTDLLARDGEALMLGHFAAGLGDDFFGFKELGLEAELGMQHLSVPSRLFFGGQTTLKATTGHDKVAKPSYTPPPPPIVLSRAAVPAQIGLLQTWYLEQLGTKDVLEDEVPERVRYKVPTNGKLPAHAMVGDDARRALKTPGAKRKRAP